MAKTKDFGSIYFHRLTYPINPVDFIEKAYSQEIDEPFRKGVGISVRLPFTKEALVIGVWRKTGYTESQALTYAINGRGLKKDELDWETLLSGDDECLEKKTKPLKLNQELKEE